MRESNQFILIMFRKCFVAIRPWFEFSHRNSVSAGASARKRAPSIRRLHSAHVTHVTYLILSTLFVRSLPGQTQAISGLKLKMDGPRFTVGLAKLDITPNYP